MLYNSSMKPKYKHNHNITYSCKYHIVWCPKYRRKVLIEGVDFRLKEILAFVSIELNSELIEVNYRLKSMMLSQPKSCRSRI